MDSSVYETGLKAAAEGYSAVTGAINERYDAEYKVVQLMEDEGERAKAQAALDEQYNAERKVAAQEYANALKKIIPPVWDEDGIQKAGADMDRLMALFREYSTIGGDGYQDPALLTEMEKLTGGMNQDDILSYIGLLQQVQSLLDGGMSESEVQAMFPELDFSKNLDELAALADFASRRSGELEGLSKILNEVIPSEMQTLSIDLDLEPAKARWAEFASNPGAITTDAVIGNYTQGETVVVPQPIVDALVSSYQEIEGGASTVQLSPSDVVAQVASYLEAEGADISALKPDQVEAIVGAYAEATGCDKSALMQGFTATIAAYDDTNAVKPSLVLNAKIAITGYDLSAYSEFVKNNPVDVEARVRLGELYDNPDEVLNKENAKFYRQDGIEIPVTAVTPEQLDASTLVALDTDGTLHVLITPVVQGTPQSVEAANELLGSKEHQGSITANLFDESTLDDMARLEEYLKNRQNEINSFLNFGGWLTPGNQSAASATISNYLDPTEIGNIQAAVSEAIQALNSNEKLSEDQIANLEQIQRLVELMDSIGVGGNIVAGIAEGMTEAGVATDAETVAANLETAINQALGIKSPSTRMKPVGTNVAGGVGVGMSEFGFAPYATLAANALMTALRAAIPINVTRPIGLNASLGLGIGILSGTAFVVAAIRSVARSAVIAAKQELKINSPSAVFRDEVGRMGSRGLGLGFELEARTQAKTIRNASRYLVGAAQVGVGTGHASYDNRRTYNYSATSAVQVDKLYVRDAQDVYAIAVEIAAITDRRQRGRGLKTLR